MIDMRESMTAKICSFARAHHSNYEYEKEKIFDDYLAYEMMGKEEYEQIGQMIEHTFYPRDFDPNKSFDRKRVGRLVDLYVSPIALSRIAYAERELKAFVQRYGVCQYVICGAGMDTFAFRNENPQIRIFETDHPDTQRYKLKKIKNLGWNIPENVRYVPIDFSKDHLSEVLHSAGFDPLLPTFYAILGVSYYLMLPVFEKLIGNIAAASRADGKIVFDYPDETTFRKNGPERVSRLTQITASLGEPMAQGIAFAELQHVLERHGLFIDAHLTPGKIQEDFFDKRTDAQNAFENVHFVLAAKKENRTRNPLIFASEAVSTTPRPFPVLL